MQGIGIIVPKKTDDLIFLSFISFFLLEYWTNLIPLLGKLAVAFGLSYIYLKLSKKLIENGWIKKVLITKTVATATMTTSNTSQTANKNAFILLAQDNTNLQIYSNATKNTNSFICGLAFHSLISIMLYILLQ